MDKLIEHLEDLHNRLVLNYNDNVPFEQYEEDRLVVNNVIEFLKSKNFAQKNTNKMCKNCINYFNDKCIKENKNV